VTKLVREAKGSQATLGSVFLFLKRELKQANNVEIAASDLSPSLPGDIKRTSGGFSPLIACDGLLQSTALRCIALGATFTTWDPEFGDVTHCRVP
jgi:hypothetical protein